MEVIGTLAAGVAHDFNNILSGVVSYPELILMDMEENDPLKSPLLTIKKAGERAAAIVQDMLTLARRGVAINEVVDLNDIITEHVKETLKLGAGTYIKKPYSFEKIGRAVRDTLDKQNN